MNSANLVLPVTDRDALLEDKVNKTPIPSISPITSAKAQAMIDTGDPKQIKEAIYLYAAHRGLFSNAERHPNAYMKAQEWRRGVLG